MKEIEELEALINNLPIDRLASLNVGLASILIKSTTRLISEKNSKPQSSSEDDQLLKPAQAAKMLGCSIDRLYRHPTELKGLEVTIGERGVRYSKKAIQAFIACRLGR